jgi:hypothetical protein
MKNLDLKTNTARWDYTKHTILCISDAHIPYMHPDMFAFLAALKKKYTPDLVVSMGDLADFHGISFHDSIPDLDSAGAELLKVQKYSKQLEKLFPNMVILGSNHGDLPMRKAVAHGLPKALFRPYNEIYGVGAGWLFIDDLTIKTKGHPDLYLTHGLAKNGLKIAQQRGQRVVQGHYHTSFDISYCGNPNELLWSMATGCLIDRKSLAFAYDRLNLHRPVIGTGVIVNGYPRILPMILDYSGRWTKELL